MGHIKPKHRRRGWAEKIIISDPAYAVLSQINSSHHLRARRGGGSRKMTWWQGGFDDVIYEQPLIPNVVSCQWDQFQLFASAMNWSGPFSVWEPVPSFSVAPDHTPLSWFLWSLVFLCHFLPCRIFLWPRWIQNSSKKFKILIKTDRLSMRLIKSLTF